MWTTYQKCQLIFCLLRIWVDFWASWLVDRIKTEPRARHKYNARINCGPLTNKSTYQKCQLIFCSLCIWVDFWASWLEKGLIESKQSLGQGTNGDTRINVNILPKSQLSKNVTSLLVTLYLGWPFSNLARKRVNRIETKHSPKHNIDTRINVVNLPKSQLAKQTTFGHCMLGLTF